MPEMQLQKYRNRKGQRDNLTFLVFVDRFPLGIQQHVILSFTLLGVFLYASLLLLKTKKKGAKKR